MEGISVIIPAYNEEAGLADVLKRVQAIFEGARPYEIIVVNDGSTDATATIVTDAGVRVITNLCNSGYGFSLKRGMREALYECIVITDADGTYPIEKIPDLLEAYDEGFDMVVGARRGKVYWASITKTTARLVFKLISEFVVGKKIPDINSGLRVIRKSRIIPMLPDLSNMFSFTTSSTLIFFLKHYFIQYIPIPYHERSGVSKIRYFRDTLMTLQIMVEIIAKYNPIKLFLLIACIPLSIAVLSVVAAFFVYPSLLITLALVSFYSAIIILSGGFIATLFQER